MDMKSTMNNTFYNITREESEIAESPIIPLSLTQNIPRTQRPSNGPDLDKWKSRVPKAANPALVPKPLFADATTTAASGAPILSVSTGPGTMTVSPISTMAHTTANPTPISPSPSLFPIPPSTNGIVASPVDLPTQANTLHPSNSVASRSSVYSQDTTGNADTPAVAAAPRPRPVSSIYSQNTLTTMTVTAASSPRTPTMTNWTSTLPGLPGSGASHIVAQMGPNTHIEPPVPSHMEQVIEESSVAQPMQQVQVIQVPRLRSPSLPHERGNRRKTISNTGSTSNPQGSSWGGNLSSLPLVQSPERVSYPGFGSPAAPADYSGSGWPPPPPLAAYNVTPKLHNLRQSQGTVSRPSYMYHVANKQSASSATFPHASPPVGQSARRNDPNGASPRHSVDSHTPICGPGEQRSGWWSDDEDVERQQQQRKKKEGGGRRARISGYAAVGLGLREKPTAGAGYSQQRTRKIQIIAGVSVLVVLIIVGIAVGVTLGLRRRT